MDLDEEYCATCLNGFLCSEHWMRRKSWAYGPFVGRSGNKGRAGVQVGIRGLGLDIIAVPPEPPCSKTTSGFTNGFAQMGNNLPIFDND